MATTTHVPVEVYLRSSYEPDAEYVDGEIELRPVGENDHSAWQAAIVAWFLLHKREWNIRIRPELRIQVSSTRFRVPDVTVVGREQPVEQILTLPPVAVFEVLSPEDRLQRLKRRLQDYQNMGIREILVVDPQDGIWYRYERSQLTRTEHFSAPSHGIAFELERIKEQLD